MLCLNHDQERELSRLSERAQICIFRVLILHSVPSQGYGTFIDGIKPFLSRVAELMAGPTPISAEFVPIKEVREHLERQAWANHHARFIRDKDWAALEQVKNLVTSLEKGQRPTDLQLQDALVFCRYILGFRVRTEPALLPPANLLAQTS